MRIAVFVAALGLVLFSAPIVGVDRPRAKTHTVAMVGMQFKPKVLAIAPGDTVVWVNQDIVAHTATSTAGGFDSKAVAPEKRWKVTVRKKGEFPYVCTYHPLMTGTLRVK
jgi:plastocyanin